MKIDSYLKMFRISGFLLLIIITAGQTEAQTITSVAVEPVNPHVAVGRTIQFRSVGTLSDGTTRVLNPSLSSSITAGYNHTCAVLADGRVTCWGSNSFGQLGVGSAPDSYSVPVPVSEIDTALSVAAGIYHSCAALYDGSIKCWGRNNSGQLGNGNSSSTPEYTPVSVVGINTALRTTAGFYHSCALLSDGTVKCWGDNGDGQLGNGTRDPSSVPVSVSGINTAIAVAASMEHSCALLSDGTVKCWGNNSYGELGNGTAIVRSLIPVSVSGINTAIAIGAGGYHACALLSDGSIRCWGDGGSGQLGNGFTDFSRTPVTVSDINNAVAIGIGYNHSCALISDETIKCWGENGEGQLGNGTNNRSLVPVPVSGINNAAVIAANAWHTCAILSDGSARCWGDGENGALGDGILHDSLLPVTVKYFKIRWNTGFMSNANMTKLALGGFWPGSHACAAHTDSAPECWGYNGNGELGNGGNTGPETCPEASFSLPCGTFPGPVAGLGPVSDLAAGTNHSCAVLPTGAVNCWGDNERGQLGNGSTTRSSSPVPVTNINSASKVTGGGSHSCTALLDGSVRCWGDNFRGQLGADPESGPEWCGAYPFTPCSLTPVTVNGINTALYVAAGSAHSCARLSDNSVQCWGYNVRGALGNGSTDDSFAPVPVTGINNAVSIASGSQHSCAALSTGEVKCWGYNGSGQLGNGNNTGPESCDSNPLVPCSTTPVNAIGISTAISIAVGITHSCALLSNGSVRCWGDNNVGQLGDGSTNSTATPVSVNSINNAFGIFAGGRNTCALLLSGGVMCWGGNYTGQLGIGTTAGPEFCTYPGPNPLDPPITEPCSTVPVQVVRGAASSVVWSSSNLPVATINNRGMATGLGDGLSPITAALGQLSGNTNLTVGTVRLFLPIILRP